MQNLFATQNPTSTPPVPGQNINISDFNTMQNLFNSSSGLSFPPPAPQTSTNGLSIAEVSKNPQLLSKPDAIFNTYSGPKSAGESGAFDMSAFGTMQKGQSVPFDFSQATSQPTNAAPNFSKKKQADPSDLI